MSPPFSDVEKQEYFFSAPQFAVIGVSKDENRPATKVLRWFKSRHLDVIPVHPGEKELHGTRTIRSLSDLPEPYQTSICIIAMPYVTLSLLKQAKVLGIPAIWLQPGSEDESVLAYIDENRLTERVVFGGPCILKEGDPMVNRLLFEETYGV